MTLSDLKSGERVFIDANIFLYHFTGASLACKDFLKRCEAADLRGVTSLTVLAETCHQLMIAEAVSRGLVPPRRATPHLQKKPDIVKKLGAYSAHMLDILSWGIEVVDPPKDIWLRSQLFRSQFGLLTNDSLIPAYMRSAGADKLATNDRIFSSIPGLHAYRPADV